MSGSDASPVAIGEPGWREDVFPAVHPPSCPLVAGAAAGTTAESGSGLGHDHHSLHKLAPIPEIKSAPIVDKRGTMHSVTAFLVQSQSEFVFSRQSGTMHKSRESRKGCRHGV